MNPHTILVPGVAWPPYERIARHNILTNPAIIKYREARKAGALSLKALAYVKDHQWTYNSDIATELGITPDSVSSITSGLQKMNKLIARFGDRECRGRRLKQFSIPMETMQ